MKTVEEAIMNFVEAERAFMDAKADLQVVLSENMPNPFMSINFSAVRREAEHITGTAKPRYED